MNIDYTALTALALSLHIDTFNLYNEVVSLNPTVEWYCKEDSGDETPVIRINTNNPRKPINRRDRKFTLKDKSKAGKSRWHHMDRLADSFTQYGLKRVQDLRREEKVKYEYTENSFEKPTDAEVYEVLRVAFNSVNPFFYPNASGYISDIKNSIPFDLTDDLMDHIEAMALGEYIAAQDRKRVVEEEKDLLTQRIEDLEAELKSLRYDLEETKEKLEDMTFGF